MDSEFKKIILWDDQFIPEKYKANYFNESDLIMVNYKNWAFSSGIFCYALKFGKTVIGNNEGIIGDAIREYSAGYAVECNSSAITECIQDYLENKTIINPDTKNFLQSNTVENFCNYLFSNKI